MIIDQAIHLSLFIVYVGIGLVALSVLASWFHQNCYDPLVWGIPLILLGLAGAVWWAGLGAAWTLMATGNVLFGLLTILVALITLVGTGSLLLLVALVITLGFHSCLLFWLFDSEKEVT